MLWKCFWPCSSHIKELFGAEDCRRLYLRCCQYLFLRSSSPRAAIAAVSRCRFRADRVTLQWRAEHTWHPRSIWRWWVALVFFCLGLFSWQGTDQSHSAERELCYSSTSKTNSEAEPGHSYFPGLNSSCSPLLTVSPYPPVSVDVNMPRWCINHHCFCFWCRLINSCTSKPSFAFSTVCLAENEQSAVGADSFFFTWDFSSCQQRFQVRLFRSALLSSSTCCGPNSKKLSTALRLIT